MTDVARAKALLVDSNYTVVLCRDEITHTDTRRGVLPLLSLLDRGEDVSGFACGMLSPIVSFALTGMPGAVLLPFMTVELAVYGLSAGLLSKTNLPTLLQVVLTQVAGRVARAAVLTAAIYGFGFDRLPISIVWTSITAGVAGIVIQWAVLPLAAREGKR